jgi:hypothetical protein
MKKLSRDQGALDAPILSHRTNQARRGSRKHPDPPEATGRSTTGNLSEARHAGFGQIFLSLWYTA